MQKTITKNAPKSPNNDIFGKCPQIVIKCLGIPVGTVV